MTETGSTVERLREQATSNYRNGVTAIRQDDIKAVLAVVEAARELYDTHEIQMYVGHEAVSGGHIGYCSRRLGSKLAALHSQASDEGKPA